MGKLKCTPAHVYVEVLGESAEVLLAVEEEVEFADEPYPETSLPGLPNMVDMNITIIHVDIQSIDKCSRWNAYGKYCAAKRRSAAL